MTLETLANIFLTVALGLYTLSFVAAALRKRAVSGAVMGAGWLANLALFTINWIAAQEPPFGNMYHVMIFLSLCFPPILLALSWRHRLGWLTGYFAFAAVIPLVGSLAMGRDIHWSRMPALQSPWFVPHVFAYMVSYALAAVAFAVTLAGLFSARREEEKAAPFRNASHVLLLVAFPFMTFGMLSGALWAEEAWGIYWSWDAKETWALITWGAYLIYFHCRLAPRLERYATLAQILAFLALLTTFLVVNLLPKMGSLLHSYA